MEKASPETPIGYRLDPFVRFMTIENMTHKVMSGGAKIHFDWDEARREGLPAPVATGVMTSAYISGMLTRFFGPTWFTSGWLEARYIASVYADDTVTSHAEVIDKSPEGVGTRIHLEVWTENQHGQKVTIGHASAVVWE